MAQTLVSHIPWVLDARRKRCFHPDLTRGETVLALLLHLLGRNEVVMGSPAQKHPSVELNALCFLTAGSTHPHERVGWAGIREQQVVSLLLGPGPLDD